MKASAGDLLKSVSGNPDEDCGVLENLMHRGVIPDAPRFLMFSIHYEALTGSRAAGVFDVSSQEVPSDYDITAVVVPPPSYIYKHLTGWVPGFDVEPPGFDQWTAHHIIDPSPETPMVLLRSSDAVSDTSPGTHQARIFDLQVLSLVRFFELGRRGTPNILEALFVPDSCVLRMSVVGRRIREHRGLFLSCEAARRFRSLARAQIRRVHEREHLSTTRNLDLLPRHDFKAACRALRMLDVCEQILSRHDLCFQSKRGLFLQVRRGEWSLSKIMSTIGQMERRIESLFRRTTLPMVSSTERLRNLLLSCLEDCYSQHVAELDFPCRQDSTERLVG